MCMKKVVNRNAMFDFFLHDDKAAKLCSIEIPFDFK